MRTTYQDSVINSKPYPRDNEHNAFHDYHSVESVHRAGFMPEYRLAGKCPKTGATIYRPLTEAEFDRCLRVLFCT